MKYPMNNLGMTALCGGDVSPNRSQNQGIGSTGARRRVIPIPLESLVSGVTALWAFEPQVHADLRSGLIDELNQLEHRVEVLRLRVESGRSVPPEAVSDCARDYLRLRERWTGAVAA